ncbi:MAG: DNA polymerase I [Spirochaetaceae bacterium]|jgi:DNA polymerase-1|nr:DNA polymerase I [Spirochaetaceae bacterium]
MTDLYLIDAYGLLYRSYFAFFKKPLRNSRGKNVSALYEFARTLVNLLDKGGPGADSAGLVLPKLQKIQRLAVVFDSRIPTFRHKLYEQYKAKRQKTPEDLRAQIPLAEAFMDSLGVPVLQADGYEADDIIATLAKRCKIEGRACYIFTADKDLLQILSSGIYTLIPSQDLSGADLPYELIGPREVKAKWGVPPEKILDYLSLTGDSSDNVPGVKGVGDRAALKLLTRYDSLDEIYQNIANIDGALAKKLAAGKESAYFSKTLIALADDVPVLFKDNRTFSIDDLSVERLDRAEGAKILIKEGIPKIAEALDLHVQKSANAAPELLGPGKYSILPNLQSLADFFKEAGSQKFFALDFETDSLNAWRSHPVGLSFALRPKEGFYVPLASHGGTEAFLDPEGVRALLAPLLADPAMTIIAHNAKFDYEVSRAWGLPRWRCRIWDTLIGAWLEDPERGNYALDSLAEFYFGYTPTAYRDIVPKGQTFDRVPLDAAARYSGEDADLCLRLQCLLEPKLKAAESLDLFQNLEMPLLPILAEMEGIGIRIEKTALLAYGRELAGSLAEIQAETYALVGHEFNLASPKQLQEVLFTERKLKATKKTKTGYSTDMDVLEELSPQDPVPALILRHRTLAKLKSTYIDALAASADPEERIHTSFVQTGTATGRLSSRDPNLQNIPIRAEEGRRIRQAFTAKPGHLLISADYSQIELVVLAHLSLDERLITAFIEGKDIHARTGALIFGIEEQNITPEQRRIAKIINFGVMYGMSAFRLAKELGISRAEAGSFIAAYFKTYAGVRKFIDELIKKTELTGYVSTILGRRRYIPTINSQNKTEKAAAERVAVNTPIQGSAADIVKTAMLNIDKALSREKSSARLLLQVHDELILEAPASEIAGIAALVRREMENAVPLKAPLRVSVETGPIWGGFH